jgi:hypothetical protein
LPPPSPMRSSAVPRNSAMRPATADSAEPSLMRKAPSDAERRENFYHQMGYRRRQSPPQPTGTKAELLEIDNLKPTSYADTQPIDSSRKSSISSEAP